MTVRPAGFARGLAVLAASAAAASLAACVHDGVTPAMAGQTGAPTPLDQYPLRASEAPVELALAAHSNGISPNQREKLADFARRWREGGNGAPVVIRTPDAARGSSPTADAAAAQLVANGVPRMAIRMAGYPEPRPDAPVVVSFMGYQAEVADCSGKWGNLMSTRNNDVPGNFGCTIHANMAAQIADPHDIVAPRALEPGDGDRRAKVLANYRDGKKTSSDRDSQAQGTLSTVAQ